VTAPQYIFSIHSTQGDVQMNALTPPPPPRRQVEQEEALKVQIAAASAQVIRARSSACRAGIGCDRLKQLLHSIIRGRGADVGEEGQEEEVSSVWR
jgi:hypothetical protein